MRMCVVSQPHQATLLTFDFAQRFIKYKSFQFIQLIEYQSIQYIQFMLYEYVQYIIDSIYFGQPHHAAPLTFDLAQTWDLFNINIFNISRNIFDINNLNMFNSINIKYFDILDLFNCS